jgi:hypothetical protein
MEAVCFSKSWYLPTSPHGVTTQKNNIHKFRSPYQSKICQKLNLNEKETCLGGGGDFIWPRKYGMNSDVNCIYNERKMYMAKVNSKILAEHDRLDIYFLFI